MGVAIRVRDGQVASVFGRVQMLSPGLACLVCYDWLDGAKVREEMLNEEQRRADRYLVGAQVPQPAVMSLNGAVTSIAISTFLSAVASFPGDARMINYDAARGSMKPTVMKPLTNCIVCSESGALGRGNTWSSLRNSLFKKSGVSIGRCRSSLRARAAGS